MDFGRVAERLNLRKELAGKAGSLAMRGLAVIAGAYVLASVTSTFMMTGMLKSAISAFGKKSTKPLISASLNFGPGENYRDLVKAIKDRNIFNSTGEFPEEKSPDAGDGEKSTSTFDLNGPCTKPKASVELVGTIVMGGDSSIATIQEQGYSEADIYREGDFVIGSDTAQIVRIERNRVIINNSGVKECLELAAPKEKKEGGAFPDAAPTKPPVGAGAVSSKGDGDAPQAAGGDCALEEKYLQDELGPGFGTIIQKARLVPNTTDNVMNGFKIFAIDASSLLAKIGLKNGDIITQVNDTSLKQPEQGFALYQAFQDEREVRVHILRGNAPLMITCRIK